MKQALIAMSFLLAAGVSSAFSATGHPQTKERVIYQPNPISVTDESDSDAFFGPRKDVIETLLPPPPHGPATPTPFCTPAQPICP
jgi:hypothetical protein